MRFNILGRVGAFEGVREVPLGAPKQRLVLAHLLAHANQVVPGDRLIDLVWGEQPPAAARASLQSYVSHLRKALGRDRIEGHGGGYLLRVDPDEVAEGCVALSSGHVTPRPCPSAHSRVVRVEGRVEGTLRTGVRTREVHGMRKSKSSSNRKQRHNAEATISRTLGVGITRHVTLTRTPRLGPVTICTSPSGCAKVCRCT